MVKMIGIIALLLTIMFGSHAVIYRSIVTQFSVQNEVVKIWVAVILGVLAFSFLGAVLLFNFKTNPISIFIYKTSVIWFGLLINLLMAAGLSKLIFWLIKLTGLNVNQFQVAVIIFCIAVAYSGRSLWMAFNPVVKQLDVAVEQVPQGWEGKRLVFLSDIHLGHFHGNRYMRRLIRRISDQDPELVLISGDLFDGMGGDPNRHKSLLEELVGVAPVYFAPGNHETYVGEDISLNVSRQAGINVLDNEMVMVKGVELIGVSFPGIENLGQIRGFGKRKASVPRFLLFHTPTNIDTKKDNEIDQHYSSYWRPDTTFDLNRQIEADIQLSGHTHRGQFFPLNLLTRYLYRGFDYGFHSLEGFALYTSSGAGTWGPPYRGGATGEIVVISMKKRSEN